MTKKQSTRGGTRANAGRKSIPDEQKKVQITLYVEKSKIDAFGGEDPLKALLYETIENELRSKSFFHET